MLGQLIKHEWKATSRILPITYLALVILYLISYVVKKTAPENMSAVCAFPIILFVIGIIGVYILTLTLCAIRFHKSMFGLEGYWTQTLPLSKIKIYCSKLLVGLFWLLCSMIVFFAAIIALAYLFLGGRTWDIVGSFFEQAYMVFLFAGVILQSILFIAAVNFCISLANTAPFIQGNVGFSFLFFIVYAIFQAIIEVLAMIFIPISIEKSATGGFALVWRNMLSLLGEQGEETTPLLGVGSFIADIVLICVLVGLTIFLLKKKVNVK